MKLRTLDDFTKPVFSEAFLGRNDWVNREDLRFEAHLWNEKIEKVMKAKEESFDLSIELPFCDMTDAERVKDWKGHLLSISSFLKFFFNLGGGFYEANRKVS